MKKRKTAKKRRKIARLQAAAREENLPPDMVPRWRRYYKPRKKRITLWLDADVLAWFKEPGRGYQTRINRSLREVMAEERKG